MDSFNAINITVGKQLMREAPFGKILEKKQIVIHSEDFNDVEESKKPKVSLQYNSENFDFVPSQNCSITINSGNIYSYKPQHKKNLSGGAIAGIVIACVVVVAVIIIVTIVVIKKKRRDK